MTSSTTFVFTSRPEMSGEFTFQFTPTQGEIIFSHEWSLKCYNIWGKYTGSGSEGSIHLPYNIQLRVKDMWGSQNFGRLYIEAKEVTSNSITVKYWIKCYHPGEWYSGLTFIGKLTCITPGDTQTEIIRTYSRPIFVDENLETEFPLESRVFIRATDGISTGGTRDCTVTTESGQQITIPLIELPDAPRYYIGSFLITSGGTWANIRLHMEEFEKATLKCDVNQDSVYSYWEIWAEKKGPGQSEVVITFADSEYTEMKSSFDAEATVFVLATGMYIGPAGPRDLRVVADSGDEIHVTLNIVEFTLWHSFFLITDGETNDDLNRLHLEPGEGATLYVDINGDGIPATCRISRNRIIIGEVVTTYEDGNYTLPEDTFDHEATVYVDATDLISTGGIRELIVKADSGDEIHLDLIEWPANHYRGSFKVTGASTSDELNQIHLDIDERAVLYCDIDGDGQSASCEIWCGTKPEIAITYATHYQIQVNTQRDMLGTMMWDSQKCGFVNPVVSEERCPDIEYAGSTLDLSAKTTYWWRIKFWINYGTVETPWSTEEAYFRGLLVYPYLLETLKTYSDDSYSVEKDVFLPEETVYVEATDGITTGATPLLGILADTGDRISLTLTEGPSTKYRGTFVVTSGITDDLADQIHMDWAERAVLSCDIDNDDLVAFHEIWCGVKPDVPVPDPFPPARYPIRKPRSKVEVELVKREWTDLQKVTAVQISNNKNPLDNIETGQATVYLSNIDKEFYPDKTVSEFYDQLFGRRIRVNLGFLDYARQTAEAFLPKMMGIVKNVTTDRVTQTAEIVALEFMDYYRTKEIKITPVYENLSLFELYCALITYCFPSWLNQTETADWDYWIDPLGFRRTNIYIGTGKLGGSEFIPIRDFSRTPPAWIYSIIPDSEAIYDDEGFRLKRGEDYEIILEETDKGTESWIHFLKLPYPTNEDGFYVAITVDIRVSVVQYKDTTLIEELEDIALVSDCRLYADEHGRLICKSNELKEEVTDTISHDLNLMALSTRKDIDSIINHVVVESRPYQIGTDVEIGTWEITFSRRPEAETGKEFDFTSDEFVENFRFDLTWNLQCSQFLGDCVGYGSESNVQLPFSTDLPLAGAVGCTNIYGHLYIEPVAFDANHITVKFYLDCIHEQHYDNAIVFSATLTCHAGGIGQPETYKGEAIDEASYQDRYIGRRKRTFTLDYLEPGDTQARQAAERILAGLRKIHVYYDCEVRGLPHLRLMDTVALTEPKADLSQKKLQVIKLVDSMEVANYKSQVGLMERRVPSAVPWYWETAEQDFIINTQEQLNQTYKFIFDSEIISYKFNHSYSVDASTGPHGPWDSFPSFDCHGEGIDENFDLPYTVTIIVNPEGFPDVPFELGTLTISLIEETPTSIEIQYKLEVPQAELWLWPMDWLGTLSVEVQFASQSPGTDGGDAPPDQPHYPPDEPDTPPHDEPDGGWDYKTEFSWNGCKLLFAGEIDVSRVLAAGFNTVLCYINQSRLDECLAKGLWVLGALHSYFVHGNKDINGAVNFVNTWKHHPAIAAWYFLDEPELHGNTKTEQQAWYNALKAADPTRDFITVFTSNPSNPIEAFNSSAFDHCGVDVYPFNSECFDYGPGKWNGDWQAYLKYCLNRWNQLTNSIGGMAVVQTYHDIPHGMLNPAGNIRGMIEVFQSLAIGRMSDGYGMYCWTDGLTGDSRGISEDAALESEVRSVNASYNWSHVAPRVW